jgi:hypothetical protein
MPIRIEYGATFSGSLTIEQYYFPNARIVNFYNWPNAEVPFESHLVAIWKIKRK